MYSITTVIFQGLFMLSSKPYPIQVEYSPEPDHKVALSKFAPVKNNGPPPSAIEFHPDKNKGGMK